MKISFCVPLLVLCVTGRAELVFESYMITAEQTLFLLSDEKAQKSEWLGIGQNFGGFTLKAFDPHAECLTIDKDGQRQVIRLVDVVKLAPFVVSARPLGVIGLKALTAHLGLIDRRQIKSLDIDEIYPDSPAAAAGIAPKDKLIEIDGIPVTDFTVPTLVEKYARAVVGQKITLKIVRGGDPEPRLIEVIVGKRKPNQSSEPTPPSVTPRAEPRVAPAAGAAHL